MKGPLSPEARRGSFRKEYKNRAWLMPFIVPWFILPVSYRNWYRAPEPATKHRIIATKEPVCVAFETCLFHFLANLHLWPQQHPATMTLTICMKMYLLFVSNLMPHNFIASLLVLTLWETVSIASSFPFSVPLLVLQTWFYFPVHPSHSLLKLKNSI